ncbi:methyltransferase domain-containing protein [Aurantiacibacter aquimixticola]|uniref:Methyltransferase domain-containing protein n=1 Tax=Aurantiacibacter aquimixticola TaxID=1958945 RepID=A0A419RSV2_9SPHN|nr:methyltransferase domain-containing protein [Aurantiacibacter aquimixticola]RJY08855.1 methyltransferase domain-containing protein [Aurantiacibacter aquimixticola]
MAMLEERRQTEELMDDPALPEATYSAVLADLSKVNRVTMAYRPTLAFLDRALADRQKFTLLDVGFGQGDMLREIARWAKRKGKQADLVGIDLNPRSAASARDATPRDMPIDYRTGDYADVARNWDVVVSSLVAHHMSREEVLLFLRFMEAEARAGWFVNDLHRHAVSYLGYPVLAGLARWHPIVRADGHTSIARSYRPAEWDSLLAEAEITQASVERHFPFRLCVSRIR